MNLILNEVLHRLRTSGQVPADVARALGVDPDLPLVPSKAELHRITPDPRESQVYRGEVPFELKVSTLCRETTSDCRCVFDTTLCDDEDRFTNQPIRILGSCVMRFEIADWRDLDELDEETGEHLRLAAPRWVSIDLEPVLPPGAMGRIDELVEERARELERLSKS